MIRAQSSASTSRRVGGTSLERECRPLATSNTKLTACWCKGLALLAIVLVLDCEELSGLENVSLLRAAVICTPYEVPGWWHLHRPHAPGNTTVNTKFSTRKYFV